MSLITSLPPKNTWNEICKEFAARRPPFTAAVKNSLVTSTVDYRSAWHSPVFFSYIHKKLLENDQVMEDFDPSICHPACVGYELSECPPSEVESTPVKDCPPDKDTCSPTQYLEYYIFPVLLPALEAMLAEAGQQQCYDRKRTKFNAGDFLTGYLYSNNPNYTCRKGMMFEEIPFVKDWLEAHPRPPIPKSLLWSDGEAALIIQSFFRGYKIRSDPEVQELREWQRDWREENQAGQGTAGDEVADESPEPPTDIIITDGVSEIQLSTSCIPVEYNECTMSDADECEEVPCTVVEDRNDEPGCCVDVSQLVSAESPRSDCAPVCLGDDVLPSCDD